MANRINKPKNVTLHPSLLAWAKAEAERCGLNFSAYIATLIARERSGEVVLPRKAVTKSKRGA